MSENSGDPVLKCPPGPAGGVSSDASRDPAAVPTQLTREYGDVVRKAELGELAHVLFDIESLSDEETQRRLADDKA